MIYCYLIMFLSLCFNGYMIIKYNDKIDEIFTLEQINNLLKQKLKNKKDK